MADSRYNNTSQNPKETKQTATESKVENVRTFGCSSFKTDYSLQSSPQSYKMLELSIRMHQQDPNFKQEREHAHGAFRGARAFSMQFPIASSPGKMKRPRAHQRSPRPPQDCVGSKRFGTRRPFFSSPDRLSAVVWRGSGGKGGFSIPIATACCYYYDGEGE
ncbi:hypothetical protein B296_00010266 [Ensete ventricosum]|uniref:Uncharacterized protein n=1 Tax=Ensete ventricosum TaxID=4639 RepID=A0A427AXF9_ENSVE|nr:hypothetical protein B296_00010266 [Ensete ventricosum]